MYRYFVKQPKTLESLAIPKIGEWIALQAERLLLIPNIPEELLLRRIEAIRHLLLCNVPKIFYNDVVTKALLALTKLSRNTKALNSHKIIGRITETFLCTEKLTSLSLLHCKGIYSHIISAPESYTLTGLRTLEISGSEKTGVTDLLKNLRRLKKFIYYNNHCTENVLLCLVENCRLIDELDLSCPGNTHNNNTDLMTHLPNLKNLTLYEATVSKVETILLNCRNIERIKIVGSTSNENLIASALFHIAASENYPDIRFRLKYFNIVSCRSIDQLQLIVQMCPLIQELSVFKHRTPYLLPLQDLQDLRKFHVNSFCFYTDLVKELLEVRGQNLLELELCDNDEIDLNALLWVNQTCPNLESLTLKFPRQTSTRDLCIKPGVRIPQLYNLKRLTLMGQRPLHERLFFLLSTCPNIESISIDYQFSLTDDIMLRVLEKNPWSCLKKLRIFKNQLSMSVIEQIVENCTELDLEIVMDDPSDLRSHKPFK